MFHQTYFLNNNYLAGIYIHIPYCAQFCTYCSFYSVKRNNKTQFIESLLKEAQIRINKDDYKGDATLYIGGGTPSVLKTEQISQIISKIKELSNAKFKEITIEVNPDDITPEYATELKKAGVNRISMGIQSFNDTHLKWMNRRHSSIEAINSYNTLRSAGFNNISLDLIFGYTGLTTQQWRENLEKIVELSPNHISAYQMSIEPGSKLWKVHLQGEFNLPSDEQCLEEYSYMQNFLAENGYTQYEVSSFCKEGKRSTHNSSYWNRTPYLGLGPGAHSYDGQKLRSYNTPNLAAYIRHYHNNQQNPLITIEELTKKDIFNEAMMLGLRTVKGVDLSLLDQSILKQIMPAIQAQIKKGNLLIENSTIKLPNYKLFISDSIIRELFAD